jgi:hypothetical protein
MKKEIYTFELEGLKGRDNLKDLSINTKKILKYILEK